jgi:hypothetical protein
MYRRIQDAASTLLPDTPLVAISGPAHWGPLPMVQEVNELIAARVMAVHSRKPQP